jgi:hypothetical protein
MAISSDQKKVMTMDDNDNNNDIDGTTNAQS